MKIDYTNLDKKIFLGFKKRDLIDYYKRIYPKIKPFLHEIPLVLVRFPDGIKKEGFYQKNVPDYYPNFIKTIEIKDRSDGSKTRYLLCENKETLLYLGNQAVVEIHLWGSDIKNLENPNRLVFDIDPSKNVQKEKVIETINGLKFILEKIGMTPYLMYTGGKGFHIVVNLDGKNDFKEVKDFALDISNFLSEKDDKITTQLRKEKRVGKVFIDVNRNSFAQTAVCPYSVRAKDGATVAYPLDWKELRNFKKYNIKTIFSRKKDPWKNFFKKKFSAKKAKNNFEKIRI